MNMLKNLSIRILVAAFTLFCLSTEVLSQELTTFVLVRHAEKANDDQRNPSLSEEGQARAEALKGLLTPMEVDAIYSTPFIRTRSTVAPIAAIKGLEVSDYDYQNANLLTELIEKHQGGTIIISGHSNTTPILVNQLLGEDAFGWLKEDEYDKIFIVTASEIGNGKLTLLSY